MFSHCLGYIGHRKFEIKVSREVIKRAEEQARGIPKSLAFNLLNILVDVKVQAESNFSGQNGKKPLDKNIIGAIKCKSATGDYKCLKSIKSRCLKLIPTRRWDHCA